ncbi:hypothetical protein PH562_16610 [Rhizobium sp. CNPSo 4062]|uniref:hypothetical protein n=1 Tax=Rhizobium sp. CNPSo 4062 TaxID=3021410 RepID=UPI0025506DE8|nr:hypothetical protein [Rhizobium sp. CNPSo 4062]MDK4703875.1 hypothetical protein [Rhizobium sp. CNPSo 4062]
MISRTSLANEIDEYDQQIADMNTGKRDCFDAYRAQLVAGGMDKTNIKTEIEAVKAAIKRRRAAKKDPMAVEEKDALIDEIFEEITTSPRAPRATRENIEKFDRETGEILDDNSETVGGFPVAAAPTNAEETGATQQRDNEADEVPHHLEPTRGDDDGIADSDRRSHGQAAGRYPESQTDGNGTVTVVGTESGTVASPKVLDGRSPVAGESRHHCDVSEDEAGQTLTGNPIPEFDPTEDRNLPNPILKLRPHCLHPGGDDCGGYGKNHCRDCLRAMEGAV